MTLSEKSVADAWAAKFGWTVQELPDGDKLTPIRVRTGFMSLLEPSKPASFREPFVSFFPEEQSNFPNADALSVGDTFFQSNLVNLFFSLPEEVDPNEKALEFWRKLHARGLDLQRQRNERFTVVKLEGKVNPESPTGLEPIRASEPPASDPKLKVSSVGGGSTVLDASKPLPPGIIVESINGNPAIGGAGS